jgi:hypothetical protein
VRPQPASDWTGDLCLPACLECFYETVGPFDVTIQQAGNPFFLPRLSALWDMQLGYRWSLSGEPCEDWDNDWLAVAHECEAVFILSCRSGRVLHDLHGGGTWRPTELFPDLNTMAACLASLGAMAISAGNEFTAPDCTIRTVYLDRAVVELQEFLGSSASARFVLGKLGWVEDPTAPLDSSVAHGSNDR